MKDFCSFAGVVRFLLQDYTKEWHSWKIAENFRPRESNQLSPTLFQLSSHQDQRWKSKKNRGRGQFGTVADFIRIRSFFIIGPDIRQEKVGLSGTSGNACRKIRPDIRQKNKSGPTLLKIHAVFSPYICNKVFSVKAVKVMIYRMLYTKEIKLFVRVFIISNWLFLHKNYKLQASKNLRDIAEILEMHGSFLGHKEK